MSRSHRFVERSEFMQRADLRTGWELRAVCLALREAGWRPVDIAGLCGIDQTHPILAVLRTRPERNRSLAGWINQGDETRSCTDCGKRVNRNRDNGVFVTSRCRACAKVARAAQAALGSQQLLAIAEATGMIPRARLAGQVLGIPRSTASDWIIATFGRDPRPPSERAKGPRAWPTLPVESPTPTTPTRSPQCP